MSVPPEFLYLYIFEGKVYNLKDWIPVHPGGSIWFCHAYGRDMTHVIHAYHKNTELCKQILAKYVTNHDPKPLLKRFLNVPEHILPEGFDAADDQMKFNWDDKKSFLERAKSRIYSKEHLAKVKKMDFLFDVVAACIFIFHLFLAFPAMYYDIFPAWLMVIFFWITRTALSAVGHYHSHRKKDGITDWADAFFDMQYVGTAIIAFDGHGMIHHT
jgi:Cytochrome b5-like Heme/Steroid binding domain